MSCNVSKIVLRAEFEELRGKSTTEVYPFYLKLLGKPLEVYYYKDEVEHFEYEGIYKPVYNYSTERWGIDLVLYHKSDYKVYVDMESNGLSLKEIEDLSNEMSVKFGVDKYKVRMISYTWYDNGDEPIHFE